MSASEQPVRFSIHDTVAVITLNGPETNGPETNGPETGNQIDAAFARAFQEACAAITGDSGVRAVVICSALPDFCVGRKSAQAPTPVLSIARVAAPLGQLKQPVIAALNGAVTDQGLELALAADIRIASPDTRFAMRQVVNGGFPFDGGTQRLTRIAGPALATEMLLTGRELGAAEAHARGLISEIAPDPGERAEQLARQIARHGSLATSYTKQAVLAAGDMTFEEGAHLEADLSFLLHGQPEREEGLAAFRKGRKPNMPDVSRTPESLPAEPLE